MGECSAIQSAPQSQSLPITDLPSGATHYVHQSPGAWPSPLFGQSCQRCLPTGSDANSNLFWTRGPSEHLCKESFKKKSQCLFQQIFQPSLGHRLSAAILSCVCSSACPGSRLLLQRSPEMQPPSIHKTIYMHFLRRARELQSQSLQIIRALRNEGRWKFNFFIQVGVARPKIAKKRP